MTWMQQFLQQTTPFLLANGLLMGLTTPTLFVSATPTVNPSDTFSILQERRFAILQGRRFAIAQVNFMPPNHGAPNDPPKQGGSRPSCPENARLVSLSPTTNLGETMENQPTFLLYFSATPVAMNFSLLDEKGLVKEYDKLIPIESKPGIFKFRLPDDAPDLEVDRLYRWIFQVSCHPSAFPQNEGLQVSGVIVRRSNPDLQTQIESASPREKVELYAENGLWYDTLNELLKLRCANPENPDLKVDWASLLEHPIVQLNDLVEESIEPACVDQ